VTHLAKDCPVKGRQGSVAANGPVGRCKFFGKKLEWIFYYYISGLHS